MSKIKGKSYCVRSALLLGTALSLLPGMAFAAEEGAKLEEIVVTAQKRAENLQVVPVAVTAITSQTLSEMRIQNIGNISALAPGLSARTGPGGIQAPNVTIRGVYGAGSFASDAGVALYIDGVYLSSVNGASTDLAELERIEVLRGPQGTLFGRNAIGGAVNVITKEPTGQFGGNQEFSYGNLKQFRSKTSVNLPAWGMLSASITYLHDQRDGDVKNLGAGTVWNYGPATKYKHNEQVSPATLGGHDTNAVAAALKLETDSGAKAVYRYNYSHKEYAPDATGIATFNSGPGFNAFASGLFKSIYDAQNQALMTPVSLTRPDAVNNWYSTTTSLSDQTHNLTITVPVMEGVSIKNLAAYRKVHLWGDNQLDGMGGLLGGPGFPILPLENQTESDQTSFQEEFQVNIDTHFVKSTFGYMHYFSHTIEGGTNGVPNAPYGSGVFPGVPTYTNFVAPFQAGLLKDDVHLKSDAVYTQNEVHIMPKLDLVLGGRYTWDRRGGLDNSPTPSAPGAPVTYSKGTPTYLVGLNYKLTDNIFTYAKLSTAFITGGRLANLPFNPENAKSYEAGIKSDLLDHTLRVNLAGYTVKYTGVQILTDPSAGCAGLPGLSPDASQCIVNGGNEKASGFETEISYVPVAGLTLSGNLGYTHTTISKTPPALLAPDGTYTVGFLPKWTGSVSAQYVGPDMDSLRGAHFAARIEADYTSSAFGSTPNSIAAVAALGKSPSRCIVDARVGLAGFNINGTQVEIAGYVKNLTDNKSITYTFNSSFNLPASYEVARMYGVDLNIGF